MFWITLSRQVFGKYSHFIRGSSFSIIFPSLKLLNVVILAYPVVSHRSYFLSCLRSHSLTQGGPYALLSSKNYILSCFTPRSSPFCICVWEGCLVWSRLIFLQTDAQLFQHLLLTRLTLSSYITLASELFTLFKY